MRNNSKNSNSKPQTSNLFRTFVPNCNEMKHELSILIPVYNGICLAQVQELHQQAEAVEGLTYEILVADDGSTDNDSIEANRVIESFAHCHYIIRGMNVGRSAIRNFLARQAHYEWLLFLDCGMQMPHDHFLKDYLSCEDGEVIDGGFAVLENPLLWGKNLRYTYEWASQTEHTAEQRRKRPYQHFRTTNFMVRRDVMLRLPFDERICHYGYEDVLFGKLLHKKKVSICHINNSVIQVDVEPNPVFMAKNEEALRTLYDFRTDLKGYSRLLIAVDGIHLGIVRSLIRLWHYLFGPLERRNLCGSRPSLTVFKLYKLGYYLTLSDRGTDNSA